MRSFLNAILFVSTLIATDQAGESAVIQGDNPDPAMRAVIQALFAGDQQSLKKHTLPHPKVSLLIAQHPPTGDESKRLIEEARELKFRQVQDYRFKGQPIQRTRAIAC